MRGRNWAVAGLAVGFSGLAACHARRGVQDEATLAGLSDDHFAQADENYFRAMGNGAGTAGGNLLLLSSGQNLLHTWDEIATGVGTKPTPRVIASACRALAASNFATKTPEKWAGESIAAAKIAYGGLTFARDLNIANDRDIELGDSNAYSAMRAISQKRRLIAAGPRLAGIANSLWPSNSVAAAWRIAAD